MPRQGLVPTPPVVEAETAEWIEALTILSEVMDRLREDLTKPPQPGATPSRSAPIDCLPRKLSYELPAAAPRVTGGPS